MTRCCRRVVGSYCAPAGFTKDGGVVWQAFKPATRNTSTLCEPAAACLEAPTGRTIRLGRSYGKHGLGRDLIHIPRRRPRAGRTVIGGERGLAVEHARLPSLGTVRLGDAACPGWIGHLHRLAFHDQVELVHGDGEDTVGVVREVLRFAGGCASIEVPGAIYPEDSQRHHMRPAVRTHRCQPTGMPVRSTRSRSLGHTLLQALGDFPPRDRWRAVAIEIPLSLWLPLCRCHRSSPSIPCTKRFCPFRARPPLHRFQQFREALVRIIDSFFHPTLEHAIAVSD